MLEQMNVQYTHACQRAKPKLDVSSNTIGLPVINNRPFPLQELNDKAHKARPRT